MSIREKITPNSNSEKLKFGKIKIMSNNNPEKMK